MSKFARLNALMGKAEKLTTSVKDTSPEGETYSARMEGMPTTYTAAGLSDLAAMNGAKCSKSAEVNGVKVNSRGALAGGKAAEFVGLILADENAPPAKPSRKGATAEVNGTAAS